MTTMMPMGSERALGRGYDKTFKIPRPAMMFHTTSDKKKATQNGYRRPEMSMGVEEDIAAAKAWLNKNKNKKTISVDDLNLTEIALTEDTELDIAISKARAVQTNIITTKKARSIKVIDVYDTLMVVTDRPLAKSTVKKCQAITMANKPCPFKSTCGNFCRKHQIKK
jgi:hypothetical protein